MNDFYSLSASTLANQALDFSEYKGKTILIVNTASKCGFTPQFEGLEKLYKEYNEKGLIVLGFPCNQFAKQEPGDAESIKTGCMLNYGVSFPMFSKVEVNGSNTHPVYRWLKSALPGRFGSRRIKWNFTKFLIDSEGKPLRRYAPATTPEEIGKDIESMLG